MSSLTLPSDIKNLPHFIACVSKTARGLGFNTERVGQVELAVEEAIANICRHGGATVPIELICMEDAGVFVLQISDSGRPFDPTTAPAPDLKADIASRPIGGLGVHLIKNVCDDVQYCREGGRNILRLVFKQVRAA